MGYARKDVEKTKKLAKKFVRYQEGAELYSIGLTKFQEIVEGRKTGIDFLSYENYNEMWRNKNRYGENRKTKVGKCKKESIKYPGGRSYV